MYGIISKVMSKKFRVDYSFTEDGTKYDTTIIPKSCRKTTHKEQLIYKLKGFISTG